MRSMSRPLLALLAALLLATAGAAAPDQAAPDVAAPPTVPAAAASPAAPAEPSAAAVPQYTIQQFLATTSMFGSSFSPDGGKLLVSSNQSGIFNVYAIPVDGGPPQQLTHSTTDNIQSAGYFPTDERFLYTSDRGGNELGHVYVRELDGSVGDLTPGDKLKAMAVGWARDDRGFFILSNERDQKVFDLYEIDGKSYERTLLFRNDAAFDVGAISEDRRWLALGKSQSSTDVELHLHDRTGGETRKLAGGGGGAAYALEFSPDGKSLWYTTDEGSEFSYLARYDLASGKHEAVLRPDWDVMFAGFSHDGRYLQVAINADARTEMRLYEAATMRQIELPKLPDADITGVRLSRDSRRMAFYASTGRAPSNLYVVDLGTPNAQAPRQLTENLNPAIDPQHLVAGKVARFRSYDGTEVPGILYLPHQAKAGAKLPALVSVHGGPGGQSRVGYSGAVQFLVNHGYAVYAVNNRGSSGYGKTFYKLDDRRHGEVDLDDCVASKRLLVETGVVDPERIGIFGGSYGGYMVLAALAYRPREFAVGVDLYGVSNWVRTLESIPAWWESFRKALYEEMGDPATDKDRLRRISPLFHADKIERPLIVLQGANDPRVLKVESDEIVAAARQRGVPVEYLVFDDEGHGISKKANQERAYSAILEYLDRHLKGAPARKEV